MKQIPNVYSYDMLITIFDDMPKQHTQIFKLKKFKFNFKILPLNYNAINHLCSTGYINAHTRKKMREKVNEEAVYYFYVHES